MTRATSSAAGLLLLACAAWLPGGGLGSARAAQPDTATAAVAPGAVSDSPGSDAAAPAPAATPTLAGAPAPAATPTLAATPTAAVTPALAATPAAATTPALAALPANGVAQAASTAPLNVVTSSCALAVTGSSGMTVDLSYAGLPANQPKTYGNFVAMWSSSIVSWAVPPLSRQDIPGNSEVGTYVMNGVSVARVPYTLTYAVGPAITDICASAVLNPDGSAGPTDAVMLRITAVGTTSVSLHYHTLGGYLPAKSGNWIALWPGRVSPFNAPPPLASTKITADVTEGDIGINGIIIARGQVYTLAYFMGQQPTDAAVIVTFRSP